MAYFNGRAYTNLRGINLLPANGALRFETPDRTPTTTSGERILYVDSSNVLQYDDGSSTTALGASGVVSSFSLNDAYDDGNEITVDGTGVTLTASIATTALQITQSGAGDDIQGTSNNWAVDANGIADFSHVFLADNAELRFGNTQGSSDAQITWNGTLLNVAGATDFDNNVTTQGTFTAVGSAGSNSLTVTAGDVSIGDGSVTATDADDAATLSITNTSTFSQTTSGVVTIIADSATSGNVIDVNADALTSGTMLHLDTTSAGFVGEYIVCFDGAAADFTVAGNGATTIAGNAGSDVFTITAGDVSIADGSITLVDADNAASLSVTNNSATSGDLLVLSGTGQTTGSGILVTGGGANITASGQVVDVVMGAATTGSGLRVATTGTYTGTVGVLEVVADSATTGTVAVIGADGLTTGTILSLESTSAGFTTGDYLVASDGSVDVFSVKRNGHLSFRQSTAPTIAATTQNGITAAAITAGSTDTCGIITTTGTSSTGDTVLTITFEEAYAIAPVVALTAVNEAAAQNADDATSGSYISSTTTTTFVITIPGASGSTPSWNYVVFEMGS